MALIKIHEADLVVSARTRVSQRVTFAFLSPMRYLDSKEIAMIHI
jgi:hypothetical protein